MKKLVPRFNLVADSKNRIIALILFAIALFPQFCFEIAFAIVNYQTTQASGLISLLCAISIFVFVLRFKENLEFLSVPLIIYFFNNFNFTNLFITTVKIAFIVVLVLSVFKSLPNFIFVITSGTCGGITAIFTLITLIKNIGDGAFSHFYTGGGLSIVNAFSKIFIMIAIVVLFVSVKQVETKELNIKKYLKPVVCILIAIALIFLLLSMMHECNPSSEPDWHTCMKCDGSGKVRNDLGYYVTCPRCDGLGALDY